MMNGWKSATLGGLAAGLLLAAWPATAQDDGGAQDAAAAGDYDRLLGMVEPVQAKEPYRIGYAAADMNAAFWQGMAYGLSDELERSGAELVRVMSAGGYGNVAEQIAQIESLGAMDLDAVIIAGAAYDGFSRPVQRLVDRGVKVVVLGAPIDAESVSFGIIQNEFEVGGRMARFICEHAPDAKVITMPGPAGSAWNAIRFEGFQAEAAKCPGLSLVGNSFQGNIAIEDGQSQATDLLLKNPDADYMYVVAGVLAVGAAQAAERLGRDVGIVTGTLATNTADLVRQGQIDMVVSEPSIVFGRAAAQYTIRLLNGDELPNLVEGILPYPAAMVPNQELTADNIGGLDLHWYDLPPEGWTPPQLQ